jgi:hypothetical protein
MVGEMFFCFYLEGTLFCLAGVVEKSEDEIDLPPKFAREIVVELLVRLCG